MQASLDRILSGRSASCSPSVTALATTSHVRSARLTIAAAASGFPSRRAAAIVAAAGRPASRPPPKAPTTKGKGASAGGKGGAKGGKGRPSQLPSKPRSAKPQPPPPPQRAAGGGSGQRSDAGRDMPAAQQPAPACKLPRPAAATIVTAAATTAAAAAAAPQVGIPAAGAAAAAAAAAVVSVGVGSARPSSPEPGLGPQPFSSPPDLEEDDEEGEDAGGDGFLSPEDSLAGSAVDAEEDEDGQGRASSARSAVGEGDAGSGGDGGAGVEGDDGELFPTIQLSLPPPTKVKVKTAEYLQSCVSVSDCPPARFPEFAVIGRSNVGKSSLINMVTGRKDLAMVSKEPGKTKCINHFLINGSWYLVDLPGYGYAKVGLEGRRQFESFTRDYFTRRPNLAMVLLLVDASIPPQRIDLEYANWLTDNEVPFALVFTKTDKRRKGLSASVRDSHVVAFKRALLRDLAFLPPSIMTSAARGLGRGELLNFIAGLRVAFERSGRLEAIRQGML